MRNETNAIKAIILQSLNQIKSEMIENMDFYGRNASKRSIKSLRVKVENDGGELHGVIEGSKGWIWMEHGAGPHTRPGSIFRIILQWLKDKHIHIPEDIRGREMYQKRNRFAAAISKTIEREGTSLHRRGGYNDIMMSALEYQNSVLAEKAVQGIFKSTI